MKTRFLRVLVLLVFLTGTLVTLPPSPVRAATTRIVVNTNDSGPGSLRQAVLDAVNGDDIIFQGVSGTILLSSTIEISNSITITGPGNQKLAVSGEDLARIFHISGENVSISGLTLTHGYVADADGGAIFHSQGTLTLADMAITHNQALATVSPEAANGGGIANYNGSLVITDSSLSYNTAGKDGGGLFSYFEAGLEMANVTVDHNQALIGSGGGLDIRGPEVGQTGLPVILDRVRLTNNSAGTSGGGLIAEHSLTLTNSLIAGNTVTGKEGGGGMLFYDGGAGAQTITISVVNSTITDNSAASSGGGLNVYFLKPASSVTLNNVTIANNHHITDYGNGGGIAQGGIVPLKLENSIIAANTSNGSTPSDCVGNLLSLDYNLIQSTSNCSITGATSHNLVGVSAQLADLADNGGPTLTMALLEASPARDAGNDLTCAPSDQRGVPRPQGAHCDIGAYELVTYRLTVDKAGIGAGLVTSIPPGIDCGSTCYYDFAEKTLVTLTASPSTSSAFDGWSGGVCSGVGTCTLTMDATKSVTAIFSLDLVRVFLPLVFR